MNNEIFTKSEHTVSLISLNPLNGEYSVMNISTKSSHNFNYGKLFSTDPEASKITENGNNTNIALYKNYSKTDSTWIVVHHYTISSYSLNQNEMLWDVEYSRISDAYSTKVKQVEIEDSNFIVSKDNVLCYDNKGNERWTFHSNSTVYGIFILCEDKKLAQIKPKIKNPKSTSLQLLYDGSSIFADYYTEALSKEFITNKHHITLFHPSLASNIVTLSTPTENKPNEEILLKDEYSNQLKQIIIIALIDGKPMIQYSLSSSLLY